MKTIFFGLIFVSLGAFAGQGGDCRSLFTQDLINEYSEGGKSIVLEQVELLEKIKSVLAGSALTDGSLTTPENRIVSLGLTLDGVPRSLWGRIKQIRRNQLGNWEIVFAYRSYEDNYTHQLFCLPDVVIEFSKIDLDSINLTLRKILSRNQRQKIASKLKESLEGGSEIRFHNQVLNEEIQGRVTSLNPSMTVIGEISGFGIGQFRFAISDVDPSSIRIIK